MNSVIAALRVNLGLDSAQFETGSKRVQQSAKGMSAGVKAAFVAVGVAAAAATAAFTIALKGAIDSADGLSKSAQSIGVAVEELSALRYAADLSGVSAANLDTSVGRLSRAMNDLATGTSNTATKSLERLGVAVTDTSGQLRSSQDVMADIAERFAGMEDGAAKTAIAIEIFGRSGAQLIPLLNTGKAGLSEMTAEAERLGLVISTDTARAAEVFNDNLTRLQAAGQGLVNGAMAALLPALVSISGAMVALSQNSGELIGSLASVGQYAGVAVAALAGFFAPAVLGGLAAVSVAIGTTMVGAVRALTLAMAANPLGLLIAAIAAAVTAAFVFRDNIRQAIGIDVVEVVKSAANTVIGAFVGAFEAIKATWANLPSALGDLVYQTAETTVNGVIYMIREVQVSINDFITDINGQLHQMGSSLAIPTMDLLGYAKLGNPFAGAASQVAGAASEAFSGAQRDYVAELTTAMTDFGTSAEQATGAVSALNEELDGGGAGGGGGKGGGTKAAMDGAKTATDGLSQALKSAQQIGQQVSSTLSSGFAEMFKGLITGSQSAVESIGNLLNKLGDLLINQGFNLLFGGLFGGGGFLGGLIPGFASGTNYAPGGMALVGERGPELVNLPRGSQVIPNNELRSKSSLSVHVSLDNELLRAVVKDESGRVVAQAAPAIVGTAVGQANKSAPAAISKHQRQVQGSDYRL